MTLSTANFTYSPADNCFAACASDLDPNFVHGMKLQSAKTGRAVAFEPAGVERDGEGELVAWVFRPLPNGPWAAGSVRVFND